jgi:exodeoxyribonuclease VII large subunit
MRLTTLAKMSNTPLNSQKSPTLSSAQSEMVATGADVQQDSKSHIMSVEDLNKNIKVVIESQFGLIWVKGELSNFKAHTSGHFYFSLKDSKSQIKAVMFKGYNSRLAFKPTDGMEVIIRGRVTVYEPRGDYQIACEMMEPVGAGALQKAFEQLKVKLKAEGLFDVAKKRPMPSLPRHIAIVTSPTGAAIRDMINVLTRRSRGLRVTLVPTIVQGPGAATQITSALEKAIRLDDLDAIIIGRGGGSIEDLWAFNDEALARAIAASPVPIISAVGHEIDFTIADFVADLRAPTPSAAAELVAKNAEDLVLRVSQLRRLIVLGIQKHLKTDSQRLKGLSMRLTDPKRKLQDLAVRNDELFDRLQLAHLNLLKAKVSRLNLLKSKLVSPKQIIEKKLQKLEFLTLKMNTGLTANLDLRKVRLQKSFALLDSLSPLRVVERGYSITSSKGRVIKSITELKVEQDISIQLSDGIVEASIKTIKATDSLKGI